MIIRLSKIPELSGDYVILDGIDWALPDNLKYKTQKQIKSWILGLRGVSRLILQNKVRVERITPEKNPEYFI
jgi:hypothetical protein